MKRMNGDPRILPAVIPAKAGTQCLSGAGAKSLGPRLRGDDEGTRGDDEGKS